MNTLNSASLSKNLSTNIQYHSSPAGKPLTDMVRLRKKSLAPQAAASASSSTAQQEASVSNPGSISGPVRNFSRPFYIRNNQEYNCKDVEEGTPRSSSSHKHAGLVAEVGIFETSLDRGMAIADAQSVSFPTQAKIDPKHSDPLRTGALDVVQQGEFANERSTDDMKQPSSPSLSATQNLLRKPYIVSVHRQISLEDPKL